MLQGQPGFTQGGEIGRKARILRALLHQGALLASGNGHDALVEGGHVGLAGGVVSKGGLGGDDLPLPSRVQHGNPPLLLIAAHVARDLHAPQEELYQLPVDGIDFPAVLLQFRHGHLSFSLCFRSGDGDFPRCLRQGFGLWPKHLDAAFRGGSLPLADRRVP